MLTTRVKVMNALVHSRLTYSCETWVLTQRQKKHINASYIAMLRKMVRGGYRRVPETYKFELSNAEILRRCKTESLSNYVARQQLKFVERMIQGDERRTTKRLLFNNNTSKKPGRKQTLHSIVLQNENTTSDELNRNIISKMQ